MKKGSTHERKHNTQQQQDTKQGEAAHSIRNNALKAALIWHWTASAPALNMFGRVFGGKGADAAAAEEEEAEVERCLQQVSEARHAEDRRDAMAQLASLLKDNTRAQAAIGSMGLPVLLSVLQEDRDDVELLKGALEVLHLSVALPEPRSGAAAAAAGQPGAQEASPPPALITADLFCRAPDNVLLVVTLLRSEPDGGCEDFYVRYSALQALGALLAACPDRLQACMLSSPVGVAALMDLLAQPLEVLRNEALLLLVGLCNGCPELGKLAAFEGAFEKLLAICGADGGPSAGDVVVQDAAELMNNLLRDNLDIQRLFREMGFMQQLPALLDFTPPAPPVQPAAAAAAGGFLGAASQYMDPSLRAAAGAAAAAAANSAVGVAASAAAAAAGAAASLWPVQVAANFLCLLETARVLLAPPHGSNEEQRAQEAANRATNQEALGQLGLTPRLVNLTIPGAPSAAVRAQALFCLGDLVWGHPQLQEYLASITVPAAPPAQQQQQRGRGGQTQEVPYLQAVLRVLLHGPDDMERAGASHLLQAFCADNVAGKPAVMQCVVPAAHPQTFGEELLVAVLCRPPPAAASLSPTKAGLQPPSEGISVLEQQLAAGRAAMALSFLLQDNPAGQHHLLAIRLAGDAGSSGAAAASLPLLPPLLGAPPPPAAGDGGTTVMPHIVKLLAECAGRADWQARPVCYSMLRLLIAWCAGCSAAVAALLSSSSSSHLALLVDLIGRRLPGSNEHTAGLAAVLLGVCLMHAPGSPVAAQQQQQRPGMPPYAPLPLPAGGGISFDALLDVLLSRVGLSQWVGAIDAMQGCAAFQAARAAPRLPAHITRDMAAAILEAEAAGAATAAVAAAASSRGAASSALVGGALGLLSQAADARPGGPGPQQQQQQGHHRVHELQPYDQPFTRTADQVAAAVQQLTLNAFSGGGSSAMPSPTPGLGAPRFPLPSSQQPPQQHQQPLPVQPAPPLQQQHPPPPGVLPGARPLIPPPPMVPGAPPPMGIPVPGGVAAAAAGTAAAALPGPAHVFIPTLPGAGPGATPPGSTPVAAAAVGAVPPPPPPPPPSTVPVAPMQALQQQLQQSGSEALAALLGQLGGLTAEQKLVSALEALSGLQAAVDELRSRNRSLAEDLIRVSQSKPGLGSGAAGANGPATANGGPPTAAADANVQGAAAADADARIAAQLRASKAELEAGVLKQQLATLQERSAVLEAETASAQEAAEEARAAAATAQADLAALSSAYNDLEAHFFKLEEESKQQQPSGAAAPGGGLTEADVQAHVQAAVEQDRQQRPQAAPGSGGGADDGDVAARIAAAAEAARSAAEAEAGEEMEDLLACLGEEQAKVEALSGRLAELGEDVDVLLAHLEDQEEEEEQEDGGEELL